MHLTFIAESIENNSNPRCIPNFLSLQDPEFRLYAIKAIAEASGYRKVGSFSLVFYERHGIDPSYNIKKLNKNKLLWFVPSLGEEEDFLVYFLNRCNSLSQREIEYFRILINYCLSLT